MQKGQSFRQRFVALLLAAVMLITTIWAAISVPVKASSDDGVTIRDDALHFIVRHWHTDYDKDATRQDEAAQKDGDNWFVVVEGYILKLREGDAGYNELVTDANGETVNRRFRILLVNQDTGELTPVSSNPTPYVLDFDRADGTLTLAIKPRREPNPLYGQEGYQKEPKYIAYEKYCGTSMSAGRKAVTENTDPETNETTSLTIKYGDGNTHIVKAHVFYNSWSKTVPGSDSDVLFSSEEIDTAQVYTWKDKYVNNGKTYAEGDILTYKKTETTGEIVDSACYTQDDLRAAVAQLLKLENNDDNKDEIENFIADYFDIKNPTKFYSTTLGLHTNKTLFQADNSGRLFLANLEAWYAEGAAADIAFVLDASGSMAFTADTPAIVNVYHILANRLGIKELTKKEPANEDGDEKTVVYAYQYTDKNGKTHETDAVGDAAENYANLGAFIKDLADNKGLLNEFIETIQDRIGQIFTEDSWNILWDKIGKIGQVDSLPSQTVALYPQHDKLIGYYEFQDSKVDANSNNYRTWFYNSIDKDNQNKKYRNPGDYNTSSKYTSADPNDFASVVNYHEEGNSFHFNDSNHIIKSQDYGANTTWGNFPINFSASNGMNLRCANLGFLLNAEPTGNSFSVSFIMENNKEVPASFDELMEILYVGAMSGSRSDGGYFRVTREGGDLVFYNGENALDRLSGVFGSASSLNTARQRFSFVFSGDNVDIYQADSKITTVTVPGLSGGHTIVFSPFKCAGTDHTTAENNKNYPIFFVDDIFVYDAALTADEVVQLDSAYNTGYQNNKATNIDSTKTLSPWEQIFILNSDVLAVLLNPNNTAHVELGVAAYNYFVYDGNPNTAEFAPLAYWDGTQEPRGSNTAAMAGKNVIGKLDQFKANAAGWYYLSHGSDAGEIADFETAKRLYGLNAGNNDATPGGYSGKNILYDYVDLPGVGQYKSGVGTGKIYEVAEDTPIRFYLDENGNLRCFFSRGSQKAACSYVYELSDNQYVKTETLQRALANFSTELAERSPASKLSAVKFSMETTELEKLLLLNWTNDSEEFAAILSQKRGDGKASDNVDGMYNYYLTGGTYTNMGIDAYMKYLHDSADENSKKFLVIITDGMDTSKDAGQTYTKNTVQTLKNEGYTIITIYLPGASSLDEYGELKPDDANYIGAQAFLTSLASEGAAGSGEYAGKPYFLATTDLGKIKQLFNETIFKEIADPMEDYSVQDYIDPRFDLLEETMKTVKTATGEEDVEVDVIWHLNAEGKVVKESADGTTETINVTEGNYTIHLTRECTPTARDPYLRYNKDKDMYYLEWEDQTIPATPVGANDLLPVWTAEFLLRAKDDFIGGNAILTNGNEKMMNLVYHPYDSADPAVRDAYEQKLRSEFSYAFRNDLTESQRNDYVKEYAQSHGTKWTRWADVPSTDRAAVISAYADQKVRETLQPFGGDISSGTGDMYKEYEKNPDGSDNYKKPKDAYPSKGFPRTTANVQLLPIVTENIDGILYLGEAVSPKQMLLEIEDAYITDSYYLDYLKRYAYQRYKKDTTIHTEMKMPLLELLTLWLEIDNENVFEKEFSLPYMYLPNVAYDAMSGQVDLTSPKTNSTGGKDTHEKDVVGILTYRWEQLDPPLEGTDNYSAAIMDYVKDNTERVKYSLTVEFTPLQVGDTLAVLNGATEDSSLRDGKIFAPYVPLDASERTQGKQKEDFSTEYLFDRIQYVNGTPKGTKAIKTLALVKSGYKLITEDAYLWNRSYKPEAAPLQLLDTAKDKQPGDEGYPYGSAKFLNKGRTLTAFSEYTLDIVSGGIALELKLLIGELEEAAKALDGSNGDFIKKFTVNAKRSFQDTEAVEKLKREKYTGTNGNPSWSDYGEDFAITFTFDYSAEKIAELKKEAEKDPDGYVTIYAMTTNIEATFGGQKTPLRELPIGTYDFSLDDINEQFKKVLDDKLHFSTVEDNQQNGKFDVAYFDELVRNGLHTTNEGTGDGQKWREERGPDGEIKRNPDGTILGYYDTPEINEDNIRNFIVSADTGADKKTVTFYVGTACPEPEPEGPKAVDLEAEDPEPPKYVPVRGKVVEDPYAPERYTNNRLGILLLSTGMTKLTIVEKSGQSNETFLYHVTGTTLGGKPVDLVVSVSGVYSEDGGRSTTILLPPGDYKVLELDTWSWKYKNKTTYGLSDEEKWTISEDWRESKTTLRHRSNDPKILEHKTVIYEHELGDKVWLTGENHADNRFNPYVPALPPEPGPEEQAGG